MKADPQIRVQALLALQAQDRSEIALIRANVGKLTILLTTASFGLTAFMFEHGLLDEERKLVLLADACLVLFIWVTFLQLYLNLRLTRQNLIARETLLNQFDAAGPAETNLFPNLKNVPLDIKDSDLSWLPALGTAAIIIKILFLKLL